MYQPAINTFRTLLPEDMTSLTPELLEETLDSVLGLPKYKVLDRDKLSREIEALYNIKEQPAAELETGNVPWLPDRKTSIHWGFWNRYRTYLETKKNFPPLPLLQLERLTDRILDRTFDPTIENVRYRKRGLVVGQVQSGKTSNYTGLICKAADAGYKLIVVLAGMHNNLRSQTQLRLDEGFLGRDTQTERVYRENGKPFGAGYIPQEKKLVAHSLTSSKEKGDMNTANMDQLMSFETQEPILLVVKKNASVLATLQQWLMANAGAPDPKTGERTISSKALFLIDDEADNASVNTKEEDEEASRINGQIRAILRLFTRSAYVGYTATPFANIFIDTDGDDLFPSNFIINLKAPSNYIGPEQVFGFTPPEEGEVGDAVLPIVHAIDDYGDLASQATGKKKLPRPDELPESLHLAIRCFIIVCAIRRLRGQESEHNSMMVHVSRLTDRQDAVAQLVDLQFEYYNKGIDQNSPKVLEELRKTFEEDVIEDGIVRYRSFVSTSSHVLSAPNLAALDTQTAVHTWAEVKEHLRDAAAKIQVRQINGGSADTLNYFDVKTGLSVIAVGGDKLSRGLTLEGLSVSYFLRPSKMYDTLMQMGRWFGYRPGYVDLCRLFTSRELNEWFCHVTLASEELRQEFVEMTETAGATPADYALRVRTHPGVLQISATNKMRNAVPMSFSLAGRLSQIYEFQKDPAVIRKNYDSTRTFIKSLGEPSRLISHYDEAAGHDGPKHFIWEGRSPEEVVGFLQAYSTVASLRRADSQATIRFINLQVPNRELIEWTVVLLSNVNQRKKAVYTIGTETAPVGLFRRVRDENSSDAEVHYASRSNILSPEHESLDLNAEEYARAIKLTKAMWQKMNKEGDPSYPNGHIVRNEVREKKKALLLIYSLNPEVAYEANVTKEVPKPPLVNFPNELREGDNLVPIVGYAISFPGSNFHENVGYVVNGNLLRFIERKEVEPQPYDDQD